MTYRNPFPPLVRPYDKGHSCEQDEKLARQLFFGASTVDPKTGRHFHSYPQGADERRAFEALQRLLLFSCGDLDPGVLAGLNASLDRGGSFERRLVFQKTRKRPADAVSYLHLAMHVRELHHVAGWKMQSAVDHVGDKYKVSSKTVYQAVKRIRRENPGLEV